MFLAIGGDGCCLPPLDGASSREQNLVTLGFHMDESMQYVVALGGERVTDYNQSGCHCSLPGPMLRNPGNRLQLLSPSGDKYFSVSTQLYFLAQ